VVQGYTPLAGALQRARDDFDGRPAKSNSNFVYVVSDGEETCDGDPVAAAKALTAASIGVQVNLIGFSVDSKSATQLKRVAQAGGGAYADARDDAALDRAFRRVGDWAAWTQYYNCKYGHAQLQSIWDTTDANVTKICLNRENNFEKIRIDNAATGRRQEYDRLVDEHVRALEAKAEQLGDANLRSAVEALIAEHNGALERAAADAQQDVKRLAAERHTQVRQAATEQHADALVQAQAARDQAIADLESLRRRVGGSS
jgi:hypothetical protein